MGEKLNSPLSYVFFISEWEVRVRANVSPLRAPVYVWLGCEDSLGNGVKQTAGLEEKLPLCSQSTDL